MSARPRAAASRSEVLELIADGDISGLAEVTDVDGVPVDMAQIVDAGGPDLERRLTTLRHLFDGEHVGGISSDVDLAEMAAEILEQDRFVNQTEGGFQRAWAQFVEWISGLFDRLTDALGGRVSAGFIAMAVVAAAGLVAFTFLARRRSSLQSRELTLERLLAEGGDPDALERQAVESAARGEHGMAVRQLFLAGLLRLDLAERITFRPGLTTGAIVDEVANETFESLARQFEDIAYGGRDADAAQFHTAVGRWAEVLGERVPA